MEIRTIVPLLALLLAACNTTPYSERYPEVTVLDNKPDCAFQSLGKVRGKDGHLPISGQSNEWSTRADMEQALARLRGEALGFGADAVVITRRSLGKRPDGEYMHIDLHGLAITNCQ